MGEGVSQHALGQTLPPGRNPPGETPPCPVHAGIHTPLPSACWDTQPPCPVHAGIHNPPSQCMLRYTTPPPPPRWPLLRTVRILRECILVLPNFRNVILEGAICCDNFIYIIFRYGNSLIKVSPQNILQTTKSFLFCYFDSTLTLKVASKIIALSTFLVD